MLVAHNVLHLWQHPGRRREDERVSQLLLGDPVEVLETSDDGAWVRVQGEDAYRGWCESRFLVADPVALPDARIAVPFADLRDASGALIVRLPIQAGVRVERREGRRALVTLPGGESGWLPSSALARAPRSAAAWARAFLGTPYLWGGTSSFGLDCSGLAQLSYRLAGLTLRRDADIQRSDPRFVPVAPEERQAGDLVFFGTPEKITHVGIDGGDGTFVHAAGGAGVIVTAWGDARYSPGYVDACRLDPARASQPVTRFEAEDR